MCDLRHVAGAFNIHRRAIKQHRAGLHMGDHLARHGAQYVAIGQHGVEHAVGAGGGDIEPRHIMPGRDQICGHRRAHIS